MLTYLCQWCQTKLDGKPTPNTSFTLPLAPDNFCSEYCSKRYMVIKQDMKSPTNKCRFCESTIQYNDWCIKNENFCNGRCIDLYQELLTNIEYKKVRSRFVEAQEQLSVAQKRVLSIEHAIMSNKRDSD